MADGAARSRVGDTVMAYADKMIYEAVFGSFYGELTFVFKAGKIVLVRKHETVIPTSNGLTDEGEAISEAQRDGTHERYVGGDFRKH
jgi:hypothetical protein